MSELPERFRAFIEPSGIVRIRWLPGFSVTGPLAAAAMAAVDELNADRQRPLLVEVTGTEAPTREALTNFKRRCSASRIALLGESPVDRVRASFATGISSRGDFSVPIRFFAREREALAWLLEVDDQQTTHLC